MIVSGDTKCFLWAVASWVFYFPSSPHSLSSDMPLHLSPSSYLATLQKNTLLNITFVWYYIGLLTYCWYYIRLLARTLLLCSSSAVLGLLILLILPAASHQLSLMAVYLEGETVACMQKIQNNSSILLISSLSCLHIFCPCPFLKCYSRRPRRLRTWDTTAVFPRKPSFYSAWALPLLGTL